MMAASSWCSVASTLARGSIFRHRPRALRRWRLQAALALDDNAALERKIAFTKTDEVERVARDQLGLLKKNEVRYVSGGN